MDAYPASSAFESLLWFLRAFDLNANQCSLSMRIRTGHISHSLKEDKKVSSSKIQDGFSCSGNRGNELLR